MENRAILKSFSKSADLMVKAGCGLHPGCCHVFSYETVKVQKMLAFFVVSETIPRTYSTDLSVGILDTGFLTLTISRTIPAL